MPKYCGRHKVPCWISPWLPPQPPIRSEPMPTNCRTCAAVSSPTLPAGPTPGTGGWDGRWLCLAICPFLSPPISPNPCNNSWHKNGARKPTPLRCATFCIRPSTIPPCPDPCRSYCSPTMWNRKFFADAWKWPKLGGNAGCGAINTRKWHVWNPIWLGDSTVS